MLSSSQLGVFMQQKQRADARRDPGPPQLAYPGMCPQGHPFPSWHVEGDVEVATAGYGTKLGCAPCPPLTIIESPAFQNEASATDVMALQLGSWHCCRSLRSDLRGREYEAVNSPTTQW